jgi:hypothetical protein
MAKFTQETDTRAQPRWAGDYLNREHLLPGGARLVAADFTADSSGRKPVASGTIVGRTTAERNAAAGWGPAADTDNEVRVVAFDVLDAARSNEFEIYRPGSIVKLDMLPAAPSAAVEALLRATYDVVKGV